MLEAVRLNLGKSSIGGHATEIGVTVGKIRSIEALRGEWLEDGLVGADRTVEYHTHLSHGP
jgi:hypothetical protein